MCVIQGTAECGNLYQLVRRTITNHYCRFTCLSIRDRYTRIPTTLYLTHTMAFPPPNNGNAPPRQSLPIPSAGQWSGLSSMSGDTSGRSFPRQSSFQAPVRWPSMNANANMNATGGSSSRAGIANGYNEVMPSIETSFAQGYVGIRI